MKQRLPLILSGCALLIALLGSTPLGQAAASTMATAVPYANVAGFAKNAGKLNGHTSSTRPKKGQIPVLNAQGKLPPSIGAVGPKGDPGAQGDPGAKGDPGPAGAAGASGYQQIVKQDLTVNAGDTNWQQPVACPTGKSVIAGGYTLSPKLLAGGGDVWVMETAPISNDTWRFGISHPTGRNGTVTLRVICATVTS